MHVYYTMIKSSQKLWVIYHFFDFFNCHGCQTFILYEIHCYLSANIFWAYYFSLSQCDICTLVNYYSAVYSFSKLEVLAVIAELR